MFSALNTSRTAQENDTTKFTSGEQEEINSWVEKKNLRQNYSRLTS